MADEPAFRPSLAEAVVAWTVYALVGVAVVVTYARIPPADTYNVSEDGLDGGLGRALVYVNVPVALAAVGLVVPAVERLGARWADLVGAAAVALCVVVGVPGVVEQADLDAKAVNAVPALGVLAALALTVAAVRRRGVGQAPRLGGVADRLRLGLGAVVVLGSIPWIAAELGFYVTGAPVLGDVFEGGRIVPEEGNPDIRAVHLGRHHGLDGALLALTALALSREIGRVGRPAVRIAFAAYVALMLVYGLANAVQDFWLEQIVKRGVTDTRVPSMVRPEASPEWLAIVVAAVLASVLLLRASPPEHART